MLLINTPICGRSRAGLGEAGADAALLLFTPISSFPGTAVLPGARGGVGASCGGLSLLGQTTTSSVGASPSPLPKASLLSPLQQC